MNIIFVTFIFFLLSFVLTAAARYLLLKLKILDLPNDRGMHSSIVPRGGGLAILLSLLIFFLIKLNFSTEIELYIFLIFYILIFGFVGFLDDIYSISYKPRLLFQFACVIYLILISELVDIPRNTEVLFISGFALKLLLVIFLVWFINLYNFMDGIDGLATSQSICFFVCLAFLVSRYDYQYPVGDFLIYASIMCGFLLWNFHKAKIFLGDVGSSTLGILIGIYVFYFLDIDIRLFYASIILMAIFIVDSSYTLIMRICRNQSFHSAHNSHAYQNFSRKLNSHSLVTSICILINFCYLFPIANLIFIYDIDPIILLCGAYFPLLIGCIYLKAGIKI